MIKKKHFSTIIKLSLQLSHVNVINLFKKKVYALSTTKILSHNKEIVSISTSFSLSNNRDYIFEPTKQVNVIFFLYIINSRITVVLIKNDFDY